MSQDTRLPVLTQHRVELPVMMVVTVTTEPGAGKDAIRTRVQAMLRRVFDDGRKPILRRPVPENDYRQPTSAEDGLQAVIFAAHKDEKTSDGETLYTLKGLQLLESQDVEVPVTDFPKWREERF